MHIVIKTSIVNEIQMTISNECAIPCIRYVTSNRLGGKRLQTEHCLTVT